MADNLPVKVSKYQLDDGSFVAIETEVPRDYTETEISWFGRKEGEPPKLGDALKNHVLPALKDAAQRIQEIDLKPDEIALEVGVKFVGEAGVVIARASAEANLVIKLKWQNPRKTTSGESSAKGAAS